MKENMILSYLHREAVNFDIDEFLVMIGHEELLTHEEEQPLIVQAFAEPSVREAMQGIINGDD